MSTNGLSVMTEDYKSRSIYLSHILRKRKDVAQKKLINDYTGELNYMPLTDHMISEQAWSHVAGLTIEPKFVFCHPDMLMAHPTTSLYYRGIALLPQKRVTQLAASVVEWEKGSRSGKVREERAKSVSRVYNAIISSIIEGSANWTLENGYRNIIATMAIGLDGTIRNRIGQAAEELVKARILDFLREADLVLDEDNKGKEFKLPNGIVMKFSSEPDIGFSKDGEQVATVEVKGGTDPAGALERLGAAGKSFAETPPGCVNFLVAGVITSEMQNRLKQYGVTKVYELDDVSKDGEGWDIFVRELFHHTVRIM